VVLEVERPQAWLRFEGSQDQEIYLSVGVPLIDRLKSYRPAAALIGPGLERTGPLPGAPGFEVPQGLGAKHYLPQGVPRFFHEPFTGTDSWIHIEVTLKKDLGQVRHVPGHLRGRTQQHPGGTRCRRATQG